MLKKLVPSLDLCRQIPAGEFTESDFYWVFDTKLAGKKRPEFDRDAKFFQLKHCDEALEICLAEQWRENPPCYPAPAFCDIFKALTVYERQIVVRRRGGWTDAALRLFLRLKGRLPNGGKRRQKHVN